MPCNVLHMRRDERVKISQRLEKNALVLLNKRFRSLLSVKPMTEGFVMRHICYYSLHGGFVLSTKVLSTKCL